MSPNSKIPNTIQTVENFWSDFQALSKSEKKAVLERFLHDDEFMKDLIDITTLERQKPREARQSVVMKSQEKSIVRQTKGVLAEVKEFVKEIANDESIFYSD